MAARLTTLKPPSPDYGQTKVEGEKVIEPAPNARQGVTGHNVRYVLAISTTVAVVILGLLLLAYFA